MAKYYGSVIGTIRGKIGDLVFQSYRGIRVVGILPQKRQHKTAPNLVRKALKGEIEMNKISIKKLNVHLVFGALGYLYKRKLESLIGPAWEKICSEKRLNLIGHNLFVQYNFSLLYHSIPDRQKIYDTDNMPDLSLMQITDGDLYEPTQIKNASYNPKIGILKVQWDPKVYIRGSREDNAHIVAIYWKLPHPTAKTYNPKAWKLMKVWGENINPIAQRGKGKAVITIEKHLDPKYLIAYLFFTDKNNYSPSDSFKF